MGEFEIPGLGGRNSRVQVTAGGESLTAVERLGLARLIGQPTLSEAVRLVGLEEPRAIELLRGLCAKGWLAPVAATASTPGPIGRATRSELRLELDAAERAEILDLHGRLPTLKHWELLGIPRMASPEQVKAAYFDLSRRFHPDRYFGKELGSHKQPIEAIFRRLKEAESTLSDPERRAAYLAANPEARTAEEAAADAITARRRAERSERLRRLHPLMQRAHGAAELAAKGGRQPSQGRPVQVAGSPPRSAPLHGQSAIDGVRGTSPRSTPLPGNNAVGGASGGPPRSAPFQGDNAAGDAAAHATRQVEAERAKRRLATAYRILQEGGDPEEARPLFLEAAQLRPDEPAHVIEAVGGYLDSGGDPVAARSLIARLLEAAPKNADLHAIYARILLEAGYEKTGRAALERALQLNPNHPYARSVRQKSRKLF